MVEAFKSISPCDEARARLEVGRNKWVFPTPDSERSKLDIVTIAYLANEKDIIMDRMLYAMNKIIYPRDKIDIRIV